MNQAPASPASPSKPRWPRIWGSRFIQLLAFVALVTVYRFLVVHISGISLFFDEAQYWDWSRQLAWGYFSKPPVVAALIGLSSAVGGTGLMGGGGGAAAPARSAGGSCGTGCGCH